jgi:gliding motility-associated-like protein
MSSTISGIDNSCTGVDDGSATVVILGATGGVSYQWTGNIPTTTRDFEATLTDVPEGIYLVTATDLSDPDCYTINSVVINSVVENWQSLDVTMDNDCETANITGEIIDNTPPTCDYFLRIACDLCATDWDKQAGTFGAGGFITAGVNTSRTDALVPIGGVEIHPIEVTTGDVIWVGYDSEEAAGIVSDQPEFTLELLDPDLNVVGTVEHAQWGGMSIGNYVELSDHVASCEHAVPDFTVSWSPSTGLGDPTQIVNTIDISAAADAGITQYTITATRDLDPGVCPLTKVIDLTFCDVDGCTAPGSSAITASSGQSACEGDSVLLNANVLGGYAYSWFQDGVLIPAATSGSYYASVSGTYSVQLNDVTDLGNTDCALMSDTVIVSIAPCITCAAPAVAEITSGSTMCPGDSVLLQANDLAGYQYTWFRNGVLLVGELGSSIYVLDVEDYTVVLSDSIDLTDASCSLESSVSSVDIIDCNTCTPPSSADITALQTTFCSGDSNTIEANEVSGYTYTWFRNDVELLGEAGNSLVVTDSGSYTVRIADPAGLEDSNCYLDAQPVQMMLTDNLNPTLSISTDDLTNCEETDVLFDITSSELGASPVLSWEVNGVPVMGADGNSLAISTLVSGDEVRVLAIIQESCTVSDSVYADILTYEPIVDEVFDFALVELTDTMCAGDPNAFWTDGLTNPQVIQEYHWYQNNALVVDAQDSLWITNSFTSSGTASLDVVIDLACSGLDTINSRIIDIVTVDNVVPQVGIASVNDSVCEGDTSSVIVSSVVAQGSSPVYVWYVNGEETQNSGLPALVSNSLIDGDVITVNLQTNSSCASTDEAWSEEVVLEVVPLQDPSVMISVSDSVICVGEEVNFSVEEIRNGGSTGLCQWFVDNGLVVGETGPTYTLVDGVNGTSVFVQMQSAVFCPSELIVNSNVINMEVVQSTLPEIAVSLDPYQTCVGDTVTVTTVFTQGGTAPEFSWLIDGESTPFGSSSSFQSTDLEDGVSVAVVLRSSLPCITEDVTSQPVVAQVVSPLNVPFIQTGDTTICESESLVLTSTGDSLQWYQNGAVVGAGGELGISDLEDAGTYHVAQSNAPCPIQESQEIAIQVDEMPIVDAGGDLEFTPDESIVIIEGDVSVGSAVWSPGLFLSDSMALNPIFDERAEGTYLYTLTAENGTCETSADMTITIRIIEDVFIPNSFSPNGDGVNDEWVVHGMEEYPGAYVKVFNRWGSEIFDGSGDSFEWDGSFNGKQVAPATYYYIVSLGNDEDGENSLSGSVTVIR